MQSLWIRWTNTESKNHIDIIPCDLFRAKVENRKAAHLVRRPNGTNYEVTCSVSVTEDAATLTYRLDENRPGTIWPGTTRIEFETGERKKAREIGWLDQGTTRFVDLRPITSLEDCRATIGRYFAIKTERVELEGDVLNLSERPIAKMRGHDISLGDRVFVWILDENKGIEWYGTVARLDSHDSNSYRIRIRDLRKATATFGTAELGNYVNSNKPQERGLYVKLKGYSHRGIRHVDHEEAQELLSLFGIDAPEADGQNEVARLIRLGKIASRPNQSAFSAGVRRIYENRCAITGSSTGEALEAAHIKVSEGVDDNELRNGILLRADIHALFDAGLIALTLDGNRLDVSPELEDPSYEFLRTEKVFRPEFDRPSEASIRHHRLRFGFAC